ncbi:arginine--tRNA ligase [Bacillus testis]|uniref:arginine--tRNA ligase n=1 Tax=Bacillus testis TaxID=1622072 RepID=UPI00067E7F8B|nr:arginine--tRNA ligase [Bacillus testis]
MKYVNEFAEQLHAVLQEELELDKIASLIEKPKYSNQGDLSFPCFSLAKIRKAAPQKIAQDISEKLHSPLFDKIEVMGGYLNVFLNQKAVSQEVVQEVLKEGSRYGRNNDGKEGVITIDMSSPNIAKPFSMGHLRSTVIGNALALIVEKNGYKPVKINHLGDWGTQFGKLITAYKLWGSEEKVRSNPIKELLELYVRFHEEAEKNPALEDEGRRWFKALEDGDQEATELWKWFREESLKEFEEIYQLLNVSFDSYAGEAFYNDKMDAVIEILDQKGLLTLSDSAYVVKLDEEELPPCLIRKSDGATLYATRDLAAAKYRKDHYDFVKSLYVVGNEQSLHFKQLKAVLSKMGYAWADDISHIPFGMMLKDGKKMSTRKGKIILLEKVLKETIDMALKIINERNPSLENKEEVAKQVGVGAVIFHDLKNYRMNDIEFSMEDMLRFEGETGPYVQYTHARACSLLRKGGYKPDASVDVALEGDSAWEVVKTLEEFPVIVRRALDKYDPSLIGKYAIDLAQSFNKYYGEVRILEEDSAKASRLALVHAVTIVLAESLRLVGLEAPQEM